MGAGDADVWLMTEKAGSRSVIKQILNGNGIRNIEGGDRVLDITSRLDFKVPDLLICSANLPGGDIGKLISQIRHDERGPNPFFPIMIVDSIPQPNLVRQLISTGPDDLLLQPLSTENMTARLASLIASPRSFLATQDYMGPARMSKKRPDSDGKTFEFDIPNPIRAKFMGQDDPVDLNEAREALSIAIKELSSDKVNFLKDRLAWLVSVYDPDLEVTPNTKTLDYMKQFVDLAHDMAPALKRTNRAPVAELCSTLAKAGERICEAKWDARKKDLRIVELLGKAIKKSLAEEQSDELVGKFFESMEEAST